MGSDRIGSDHCLSFYFSLVSQHILPNINVIVSNHSIEIPGEAVPSRCYSLFRMRILKY